MILESMILTQTEKKNIPRSMFLNDLLIPLIF